MSGKKTVALSIGLKTVRVIVTGETDLVRVKVSGRDITYAKRRKLLDRINDVIGDSDALAGSLPSDECDAVRAQNEKLRRDVTFLLRGSSK